MDLQEGHEDGINCMAVSADDSFLVSGETTVHQEDEFFKFFNSAV